MEKANPNLTTSYLVSWSKLSFQKLAPLTPSSVDEASFQGGRRCHSVAVDTGSWESVHGYSTVHSSKKHFN